MYEVTENLESAIESYGLESVILHLADIASMRAANAETEFLDSSLARSWHNAADKLARLADTIPDKCK